MANPFMSMNFERAIYTNVIKKSFPKLLESQQNTLHNYLCGLIQFIAICYDFYSDINGFTIKLKQNNYKDLTWLLTCLLPYIDSNVRNPSLLTDLNELYALRYDNVPSDIKEKCLHLRIDDINLMAPKYVFSNIQYGRFDRTGSSYKSVKYDDKYLQDNYYLLLDTVKNTRYKFHVNWIDIIPYRMDNYGESRLYLNTLKKINENNYSYYDPILDYPIQKRNEYDTISRLIDKVDGVNIEDIYDTISMDLYESIVMYKWLLFDVDVITYDDRRIIVALIQALNIIINLFHCIHNSDWNVLSLSAREEFSDQWNLLLIAFEKNIALVGHNININAPTVGTIMKCIALFFDRKYSKTPRLLRDDKTKYIPLSKNRTRHNIDDYEESRMSSLTRESILPTLKSIRYVDIYSFMSETLQGFKSTWYANYLMNKKRTEIVGLNVTGYSFINSELSVTFKNVYNFAKSFVHESSSTQTHSDNWFSDNYVRFPLLWSGLNQHAKNIVINRLNNRQQDWFNIRRNIFYTLKSLNEDLLNDRKIQTEITHIMEIIYRVIHGSIANIVFEIMIIRGVLSQIIVENELTNNSIYDVSNSNMKKDLVEKITSKRFSKGTPYADNAYYYLTSAPYGFIESYYLKLFEKAEYYDYFKICSTPKMAWYLATVYHWIAQLGFCHRFINNRVNFITGATGAGKTTETPKLYLYYLKAIEHISDPTILVTVPRTNVATKNSIYVAQCMAVPYLTIDPDTNKEIENDNYYIQYKHMKGKHISFAKIPKIRFITDGSVLEEVKDPLLKIKKINKEQCIYLRYNKYNVIIVDEAHEHNANMDMILSLMRNATFYNNMIRLVIMSATMNDDEPVYRRFYRNVNDNRKYPLNDWIKKHNIDRINTDRRFHISPPEQTTRFKIDEYYYPDQDPNQIVKKVITSTIRGDILLFQPGVADINKSINFLNNNLPDNVIAIPYHAQLPDHIKNFVQNIATSLKYLRINRNENFSLLSEKDLTKGHNNYDRAVIVSTNIAEASITIDSLRYVVDTGIEKTMKFDFESRANTLIAHHITDASRIQRKGRVGRTAPGTVYYAYGKNELAEKKQFNISVQDIHQNIILNCLRDMSDYPIFTELVNIIVSGINTKNLEKNIESVKKDIYQSYVNMFENLKIEINTGGTFKEFIESIIIFIIDHYTVNGEIYDYYGNDRCYDYNDNTIPPNIYFSGFDKDQLVDSDGMFYIVHPDELDINRNIGGDVISSDQNSVKLKSKDDSKYKKYMISNKMLVFWETLINMGLVGISDSGIIYKTKIGGMLQNWFTNMTTLDDDNLQNVLFLGYALSKNDYEFERILSVVTILNIIGSDMSKLINTKDIQKTTSDPKDVKTYKIKFTDRMKKIYGGSNVSSDLDVISNICDAIDDIILKSNTHYIFFKSKYFEYKTFLGQCIENIENSMPADLDRSPDGQIKRMNRLDILFEEYKKDSRTFIDKVRNNLYNTCIDIDIIEKFIFARETHRRQWKDLINNITSLGDKKDIDMTELKNIFRHHRNLMDKLNIDIVKGSYMLANPYNIFKKITHSSSTYISIYNPHIRNIHVLAPSNTFIDREYTQNYVLVALRNIEYDTIGTIISISKDELRFVANIYNIREMSRKFSSSSMDSDKLYLHVDAYLKNIYDIKLSKKISIATEHKFDFNIYAIPEHIISLLGIRKTIDDVKIDIRNIQDSDIWSIIDKWGFGYDDYRKILKDIK